MKVIKSELFRISKLKSLKVFMVLELLFMIGMAIFIKIDQSGVFTQNDIVQITKPTYEGDSSISVVAKKSGIYEIQLINPYDVNDTTLIKAEINETPTEVSLNTPLNKGSLIGASGDSGLELIGKALDKDDPGTGYKAKMFNNSADLISYLVLPLGIFSSIGLLVIAVVVFASDYTHKRFKNYIHFVSSRTELFFGKFLAALIASLLFNFIICIIDYLVIGILFGVARPVTDVVMTTILINIYQAFLTSAFTVSLIAFLSVVLKGLMAGVVGIFLFKTITLPIFFSIIIPRLSTINSGFLATVKDIVMHVYNNGTVQSMTARFTEFISSGNLELIIIPSIYCLGYIAVLIVASHVLFVKTEI